MTSAHAHGNLIDLTISLGRTPLKGELSFQDSKCGGNKENN